MVRYVATYQFGHILYLNANTAYKGILYLDMNLGQIWKFSNTLELLQKTFSEVAINGKISALWSKFFWSQGKSNKVTSLHIVTSLHEW